jgi:septum formation protein
MKNPSAFIYLASQSPRRSQLLSQIGVRHEVLLPNPMEDAEALETIQGRESPQSYVQRVTSLKLAAALARMKNRNLSNAPILCSDTTVALGRRIFGKPENAEDAKRMLHDLSGRTHRVLTAVAVEFNRQRVEVCSISQVSFMQMSSLQIDAYVDSGEPMGKAGSYAVQGRAATLISRISGSYSGIMGLPLFETAASLKSIGFHF